MTQYAFHYVLYIIFFLLTVPVFLNVRNVPYENSCMHTQVHLADIIKKNGLRSVRLRKRGTAIKSLKGENERSRY